MGRRTPRAMFLGVLACALVVGMSVVTTIGGAVSPATAADVVGEPWTWGNNGFGQLGTGGTTARRTPAPVDLDDVVDLHGGREHVAALRSDGTVWVWGSNAQGQLGLGGGGNRSMPVQVPGISNAVAVETGHNFTLALLQDGSVRTWGLNTDGQLGDGTTSRRSSPVPVTGVTDAIAIAAGRNMSYAIRENGTVLGWGRNDEGQVGDGTRTRRLTPVRVGALTGVVGIAGGRDHGLALRADGSVWVWGSNNYGQVGDGTTTDRISPTLVTTEVTEVIAGAHHSYALHADGRVMSWGRNYRANLGDGTTTMRRQPVFVGGIGNAVSIGSGRDFGSAVLDDGRVRTWGHNASGQLGDGTTTNRTSSVLVPGVSGAVKSAGGGAEFAVVLVGSSTSPPGNQDPTARFGFDCLQLRCEFDGSTSTDPDGGVASYRWEFGDDTTTTGASPAHEYAVGDTYAVTLTVTDADGATDDVTHTVAVTDSPPPDGDIAFRASSVRVANARQPAVTVPGSVQPGDQLLLFLSANRTVTASTPAGWTSRGAVTDGADLRSWVFSRTAAGSDAAASVRTTLGARSKVSMVLLAYDGASAPTSTVGLPESGSGTSHTAPAVTTSGPATVVRSWVDKSSTPHGWTVPGGVTQRATVSGSGGGLLSAVAADSEVPGAGDVPAVAAVSGVASAKAIGWSVVLPPS